MKNTSRRKFLRNTSLVTGGLLVANQIGASNKNQQSETLACAPDSISQLTGTVASVKSGNWSDPATWGGRVPAAADTPVIAANHTVNYDVASTTVAGININAGGTLKFDTGKTTLLQSTRNMIVQGILQMQPASRSVNQTLRFTGITETNFAGGGMDPIDSDVGLWVMGSGQLNLVGTSKTSWARASGSINAGATSVALDVAPSGWATPDEVVVTPTEAPTVGDAFRTGFDLRSVSGVSGSTISLSAGVSRAHPKVNNVWGAEVVNLTRNVNIEGTSTGKSHIFIRSNKPQTLRYVQIRYMGPRKDRSGDGVRELVPGRYGIHFHHCMEGSRGTVVEGCTIRDTDNHAYVPHISHGITMKGNSTYNTTETAFWWDPKEPSHDIVWENNVVALCKFVGGSKDMNAEDAPTFASQGFLLGIGDNNVCNNNVVCGTYGDQGDAGAFTWEADNEGVWVFKNNIAHNNTVGVRVWQNSPKNHVLENTDLYHNVIATGHGAYANSYTYKGGTIYGNYVNIHASSNDTTRVRFENIAFDGAGFVDYGIVVISSPIPSPYPIFIRGCSFKGFKIAGIANAASKETKNVDVIQCTSTGTLAVMHSQASSQEFIRVQPASGQAVRISKSGSGGIANFAPSIWGNGSGLKGEYYNDTSFQNKVLERTDSVLAFTEWGSIGVNYRITSTSYSVRWTGQVQPQFSETYTFMLQCGGGFRLWVDNKLLLDSWTEHYPGDFKGSINLVAGQKYDIKIEYFNTDGKSGMGLFWSSPSLALEYIPQSQLFSGAVSAPAPPPAANQGPVANAGSDITITLPVNYAGLNGSASSDPDGSIVSYQWTAVNAPSWYNIQYPDRASTGVYNMNPGTYVFRLQVTDNKGATATDDVTVVVRPQEPPAQAQPVLTITASPNPTTSTFRITVSSTSNALISVTIMDSSGNVKDTFNNLPNNSSGLVGQAYQRGTYYAVAKQGSITTTIQLSKL